MSDRGFKIAFNAFAAGFLTGSTAWAIDSRPWFVIVPALIFIPLNIVFVVYHIRMLEQRT